MPFLLLLKGQPGCGKSTLGRALAETLKWPIIDKDDARNAFQPLFSANHHIDWNSLSYDVMFRYAASQLACGLSVVIDCPLARVELYERATRIAEEAEATVLLIECVATDVELWKKRVEVRGQLDAGTDRSHKPGSWQAVEQVMNRNNGSEGWSASVNLNWKLLLNTTADFQQQLDRVLNMIQQAEINRKSAAIQSKLSGPGLI